MLVTTRLIVFDLLGALLLKEDRVHIGEDATLGDGDGSQKLVELLVVADSQLDVAGHNAALLVVTGSIASELKDLSSQVLKDGGKVHRGTSTDTGSVSASLEVAANTADRELQTSL